MSVLTVPILPQPIGDICNFDFSLLENMKTHIATEHQIQWANWPPQQCQCPASGKTNPLKWKNSSACLTNCSPVTLSSCSPTAALTQTCDRLLRATSSTMITKRCAATSACFGFHLNQALDNVTESKVVMAEARQLLDFFMRKNFINEFGESSMHIMKVKFWSQLKSSLPGMSIPLWGGLRPSEGFSLHREVPLSCDMPQVVTNAMSKVQQQDPAVEGVWPYKPLDPAGAGSRRSES